MPPQRSNYFPLQGSGPIPEGWDGVRVGSETCSSLLPSASRIRDLSEEMDPRSLSLVTSVAGPDEIKGILSVVSTAIFRGWGEIVINDWGILDAVTGSVGTGITAGRLIMRFRRGPGVFDPWDALDSSSRRYFAWGPLYDSSFLAFLKVKGVDRIELDPPRHWLPVPDVNGFQFSMHQDTRLVSVSAACPWLFDEAKGTWRSLTDCKQPCSEQNDVVMTSPQVKGALLMRERAIFEPVDIDIDGLDLPETVDRIINSRSQKPEKILRL